MVTLINANPELFNKHPTLQTKYHIYHNTPALANFQSKWNYNCTVNSKQYYVLKQQYQEPWTLPPNKTVYKHNCARMRWGGVQK